MPSSSLPHIIILVAHSFGFWSLVAGLVSGLLHGLAWWCLTWLIDNHYLKTIFNQPLLLLSAKSTHLIQPPAPHPHPPPLSVFIQHVQIKGVNCAPIILWLRIVLMCIARCGAQVSTTQHSTGWRSPERNKSRDKMTNHISFNKRWVTTFSDILRFTF